ncbi:MAG: adenosylcobinamide-phosphate synthase [Rhodobacterales bacterium]|nr:MAG: adenosylcobinamide-phosphate synthase [Rhodobacterales bacterium]
MQLPGIIFSNPDEIVVFLLIALLLDAIFGEPRWLWSRLNHPAVLMGTAIGWADVRYNRGQHKRLKGVMVLIILCVLAGSFGMIVSNLPDFGIFQVLIAAIFLAQKSLTEHVSDVAHALRLSTGEGRLMVSRIVARDTKGMDDSAAARSAIESAAENLSDGVVAPAFWFLLLGLPGLLVYKMTNTADSMIGYMSPKYRQFGWAAARFDDVLNWIPARLTALLILVTNRRIREWKIVFRDAPLHRSPNAGWPEAAMAVSLGIALSGPRSYDGRMTDFPFVHDEGRHNLTADDIQAATCSLWRVWWALVAILMSLAVIV